MSVTIIQQQITAGGNFDATLPGGTPTSSKDIIKRFPAAATGGLFDFELEGPAEVMSIEFVLGGQSSWSISKKDSDGDEVVMWAGTTEADFMTIAEDRMQISEEETILVRTTGASTAMKCRISVRRLD